MYEPGWIASDNTKVAPTDTNLACDANFETVSLQRLAVLAPPVRLRRSIESESILRHPMRSVALNEREESPKPDEVDLSLSLPRFGRQLLATAPRRTT
jgi:hypothetical protein